MHVKSVDRTLLFSQCKFICHVSVVPGVYHSFELCIAVFERFNQDSVVLLSSMEDASRKYIHRNNAA